MSQMDTVLLVCWLILVTALGGYIVYGLWKDRETRKHYDRAWNAYVDYTLRDHRDHTEAEERDIQHDLEAQDRRKARLVREEKELRMRRAYRLAELKKAQQEVVDARRAELSNRLETMRAKRTEPFDQEEA